MTPENKKYKRLVALFLFGLVLLNYPILSLLNIDIMIFGLPLLYVYIFCIWGLLIFLSALVTNRSKEHTENSEIKVNIDIFYELFRLSERCEYCHHKTISI